VHFFKTDMPKIWMVSGNKLIHFDIMRSTIAIAWILLFLATSLPAADGTNVFDVRQFGAKGDGRTLDTTAIQI
jgi:hypothetical protein